MSSIRLALALCTVMVTTTLLAPGAASAAGNTALVHGKKAGPVSIPVTQRTVASLALTKGRWFVIAKAVIVGSGGSGGSHLGVDCRLSVGSRSDLVSAAPAPENADGSRVPIQLTTAGKLRRSGAAVLRCAGELGGAAKIRDIRIMAIRVGTLTTRSTVNPAGGTVVPAATTGSGKPIVISAKQGSPRAIPGDDSFYPVAHLPLSTGRWWVIAKGVGSDGSTGTSQVCRIEAGGDADTIRFPLGLTGLALDATPFALHVVHDFGAPSSATLFCRGSADYTVRNVVMSAIKVGTLTNEPRPGPAVTSGSGSPRVISGWNDGPIAVPVSGSLSTMLTLPLPQGKWLVEAKAWFEATGVPGDSTVRRVACQLAFSGIKDDLELRYMNNVTRVGIVVGQVVDSSSGGQSAVLRCRRTHAGGDGHLHWVKITALRVGSITPWPL